MSFTIDNYKIYNLKEVSEITGLHGNTLRSWIKSRKLVARKLGRAYFVQGQYLKSLFTETPPEEKSYKQKISHTKKIEVNPLRKICGIVSNGELSSNIDKTIYNA